MFFKKDKLKELKNEIDKVIDLVDSSTGMLFFILGDLFKDTTKEHKFTFEFTYSLYVFIWLLMSLGVIKDKELLNEAINYYTNKFYAYFEKKGISSDFVSDYYNQYRNIKSEFENPTEALKYVFANNNPDLIGNLKSDNGLDVMLNFVEKSVRELAYEVVIKAKEL